MNNVNFEKTGSLIKYIRKNNGLTQQDLAKVLKVSKPAISQWEKGHGIKLKGLYAIARYFGVSVAELIIGKLNNESNLECLKRNYDLSNYDFDEIIDNSNIDELKEFFTHVNMVIKSFYLLLPKWAKDELKGDQVEEFNLLKKYFMIDRRYVQFNGFDLAYYFEKKEKMEKVKVKEILEKIKNMNEENYKWELSKLYNLNFDLKIKQICNSNNMKALECLLTVMNQPSKDAMLMDNLYRKDNKILSEVKEYTDEEIEQIPYFKVMLNGGCRCMTIFKPILSFDDEETFNSFEKVIKVIDLPNNENINYLSCYASQYSNAAKHWKDYSYEEYMQEVNMKRTRHLLSLVNDKNNNPIKYYNDLVKINEN